LSARRKLRYVGGMAWLRSLALAERAIGGDAHPPGSMERRAREGQGCHHALVVLVRWLHGVRRGAPLLSAASSAVLIASEWRKRRLFGRARAWSISLSLSLAHQQHPQHTQQPSFRARKPPSPPCTLQPGAGESNFTPVLFYIFSIICSLSAHLAGIVCCIYIYIDNQAQPCSRLSPSLGDDTNFRLG
jgi:hypothetical protein